MKSIDIFTVKSSIFKLLRIKFSGDFERMNMKLSKTIVNLFCVSKYYNSASEWKNFNVCLHKENQLRKGSQ